MKHLAVLEHQELVETWTDRKVEPGTEWDPAIDHNLQGANLILLLISSDFLSSNYCWREEMTQTLRRHDRGDAHVIPIILRACDWKLTPFGKLQALPAGGAPIAKARGSQKDEIFAQITQSIRQVVKQLLERKMEADDSGPVQEIASFGAPTEIRSDSRPGGGTSRRRMAFGRGKPRNARFRDAGLGQPANESDQPVRQPRLNWSAPTRRYLPIILIGGWSGFEGRFEQRLNYQGFEIGCVYPRKRSENRRYEGMMLRIQQEHRYYNATNVVDYSSFPITRNVRDEDFDKSLLTGHKLVMDVGMGRRLLHADIDPLRTLWVFRYHDLKDRSFSVYGQALVRLIQIIQTVVRTKLQDESPDQHCPIKVNIIAHSLGGLIVREAIQKTYPELTGRPDAADQSINKIVTLGTPHKGISLEVLRELRWLPIEDEEEVEHFSPDQQRNPSNPSAWVNLHNSSRLNACLRLLAPTTKATAFGSPLPQTSNGAMVW